MALLHDLTDLPVPKSRKLIGSWLKRTSTEADKEGLLAIVRAARRAGTHDPVPYIEAALNDKFPPPPDPKTFPDLSGHSSRSRVGEHSSSDLESQGLCTQNFQHHIK